MRALLKEGVQRGNEDTMKPEDRNAWPRLIEIRWDTPRRTHTEPESIESDMAGGLADLENQRSAANGTQKWR